MNIKTLQNVVRNFNLQGDVVSIEQNHSGNINKTFVVTTEKNKYLLQRINTNVFPEPYILMHNIESITQFLSFKLRIQKRDVSRETLSLIKTNNNDVLYTDGDFFYRMYNYITNTHTVDKICDTSMFYNIGEGLGHFHQLLSPYPKYYGELEETIVDFHNTQKRYIGFLSDVKHDVRGRVSSVLKEIVQIVCEANDFDCITSLMRQEKIPKRVTHNDTKVNNFMLDNTTNKVICVVDLDTIMLSSVLFDFGDTIRSGANPAGEEEVDTSKVYLDLDAFDAFSKGYLSQMKDELNDYEIENLALSCKIITYELAMRFLNDYINGDTYFKCSYPEHNLVRARNQLALAQDIDKKLPNMKQIITNIIC